MVKVRLRRGVKWTDSETGITIRRGQVLDVPDEVVARSGDRLQIQMDIEKEKKEEDKDGQHIE